MNEVIVGNINKYAKMLSEKKYIRCGYIAAKDEDGIVITKSKVDFTDIKDEDVVFVNDKNLETLEGNFRAAAVILLCAIKQDKTAAAAAIVDSENILVYSAKNKVLKPILDDMAQICGISIKPAKKNIASEILVALNGQRNCCFMPNAGAVVVGRTLDEVFTATLVLDKACNCELLAEGKGLTTVPHKPFNALLEHVVFKMKYSKVNQAQQKEAEGGEKAKVEEKPSAVVTDEDKKIAQEIKDAGLRLLDENLVQGTWGNIGVKLDEKTMFATPSGIDYVLLQPEQMAKVDMDTLEWTGTHKATSEKGIHAILLKTPGITATIHTHPVYGCILAAIGKSMPVPEQFQDILGKEIPCAKAALPGTSGLVKNVAEAIGDAPACFMGNHGVIVRGKDMDDAFNICRALEQACEFYLTGNVTSQNANKVEEVKEEVKEETKEEEKPQEEENK